jgi:hypothetical protein
MPAAGPELKLTEHPFAAPQNFSGANMAYINKALKAPISNNNNQPINLSSVVQIRRKA